MSGRRSAVRSLPALLGGRALFDPPLRVTEPTLPPLASLLPELRQVWRRRELSNHGPIERALAKALAESLGAAHVVTAASGTLALAASLRALGVTGEVVVPDLTFSATAHAVLAAGARPVFADVDAATWLLTAGTAMDALTADAEAVVAVHLYGTPCDRADLGEACRRRGVALVFDAAHALGARYADGGAVGSGGRAEAFSLHATKIVPAGEGGAVATGDAAMAERCTEVLSYGDPGDGLARRAALSGKLPELSALLALLGLPALPERIARREALVARYRTSLADVPGLAWQAVPPGARPNRQFLPVSVDPDAFGLTADELATALAADGIEVRRYFAPPLHRHPAFAGTSRSSSPTAERIAARVVCLPLSSHLRLRDVDRVCHALVRLHARHGDVRRHLGNG